jgi:AAA15 family ATPase/GTPase
MRVIEKIEIKSFRSFGNRKQSKTQVTKIEDLNIFSGANDSGKSNVLRALNLFFNKRTDLSSFLDFESDFFKRENPDDDDIKQEQITIKLTFINSKNKGVNLKNKDYTRLPERFWVSRKWLKSSEFSSYQQDDGVKMSFKAEKKENWQGFYEDDEKTLKSNVRANLSKQLTDFLASIQYHYVPAIKDKDYFSHLYGELQQTLLKEESSNVNEHKGKFQSSIQQSTENLMTEFKSVVNNDKLNISAVFELPDLIDLFKTLNVQTGKVNLLYRGDGIQAKLIPEILNFIATKEMQIKPSQTKKGEKPKRYFIWGFEEPENSYEYKNAQLLAERFRKVFTDKAQIFLTTHSFNFLSIEGDNVSTYRVWKDEEVESSKVTRIKKEAHGKFSFEDNELKNDSERLNEELGVFQLNQDLERLFIEAENKKKEYLDKANSIGKPVIYTEGNNVAFIEKAKEFFAPDLDVDIESLGGKTDIKKFFQRFSGANFSRYKIFFVFDCDAVGDFQACDTIKTDCLIPYIFKQNELNSIAEVKNGIENLFPDEVFGDEDKLFSVTTVLKDENVQSRKRTLRKPEFCSFICDERNLGGCKSVCVNSLPKTSQAFCLETQS